MRLETLLSARSRPNLGVLVPEGCFGWDLDGDDAERIAELQETLGALPPTMGHETPNGRHAVYRWPSGVPRPGGHLLGVVTRWRDSGYLVGASSRIGEKVYRLRRDEAGDPLPIVDFPRAWVDAALAYRPPARKPAAETPTGKRHPDLVATARHLAGRGVHGEALVSALAAVNAEYPGGGKPEAEVREIVAWADTNVAEDADLIAIAPTGAKRSDPMGIDAADLIAMDLPPLRWIVPDLLPEGTTVVASPPKIGKSCLIYQVVTETALGGALLGRRVTPGSALYYALEDGARRGRDRLLAALAGRTMPAGRLEVRWSAPAIGQGLEDEIARWLDAHPDASVVALDTLGKVRGRGDAKANAYQADVDDLGRLQRLFRDRDVAFVVVHHSRKQASDDFLESVSGTYGVTGSADTTIVIKRKRLEAFGTIEVTGRDVADAMVSVRFDGLTWHAAPVVVTEGRFERAEVYEVIRTRGPIFPAAIGELIGKERTAIQHMVSAMVDAGAIARTNRGYVVASQGPTLSTIPTHSLHSQSVDSEGGYSRAGAREGVDLTTEAREIFGDALIEPGQAS